MYKRILVMGFILLWCLQCISCVQSNDKHYTDWNTIKAQVEPGITMRETLSFLGYPYVDPDRSMTDPPLEPRWLLKDGSILCIRFQSDDGMSYEDFIRDLKDDKQFFENFLLTEEGSKRKKEWLDNTKAVSAVIYLHSEKDYGAKQIVLF